MRRITDLKKEVIISAAAVFTLVLLTSAVVPSMVNAQDNRAEPADDAERQAIPDSIKKYELVNFDALEMRNEAENGEVIRVYFENIPYDLQLEPNNLRAVDFKATIRLTVKKLKCLLKMSPRLRVVW